MDFEAIANELLAGYFEIRSVAHERAGNLQVRTREGAVPADAAGDYYDELLVNPALVDLAAQRGSAPGKRLRYLLVAYADIYHIVVPRDGGHLFVAVNAETDARAIVAVIENRIGAAAV